MNNIDQYSYELGIIECFNEMIFAGLKRIALSHPCETRRERDSYLEACKEICEKYQTNMFCEDDPLLTDLFPEEMNKDKFNIVFYRTKEDLEAYKELKERKNNLLLTGSYEGKERERLAWDYGRLLSYPEEGIKRLLHKSLKG